MGIGRATPRGLTPPAPPAGPLLGSGGASSSCEDNGRTSASSGVGCGIRDVPISTVLAQELSRHQVTSRAPPDDAPVFQRTVGTPINREALLNRMLEPAVRRAGMPPGRPLRGRAGPGMSLQDLVLRTAVIYDSRLPPPAGRGPITKNA